MAVITLTVPNPVATRVTDAICNQFGYTGTATNGTPQTKQDFLKEWLINQLKQAIKDYESKTAATTAAKNAATDVDTNIIIT